jgi:hypothetical protein
MLRSYSRPHCGQRFIASSLVPRDIRQRSRIADRRETSQSGQSEIVGYRSAFFRRPREQFERTISLAKHAQQTCFGQQSRSELSIPYFIQDLSRLARASGNCECPPEQSEKEWATSRDRSTSLGGSNAFVKVTECDLRFSE